MLSLLRDTMLTFIQNFAGKTITPVASTVIDVQPVEPTIIPAAAAKMDRYNLRVRRPVVYREPNSDEEAELR